MNSRLKSFTLIELLIVIAIVGIISGLIISGVGNSAKAARDAKRTAEINVLTTLIVAYGSGNGSYPTTPTNLSCCIGGGSAVNQNTECGDSTSGLIGAFPNTIFPTDPLFNNTRDWCYMYHSDGTQFSLSAKLENNGAISINSPDSLVARDPKQKYTNCPTGFISGPGFCVMKYEAKILGSSDDSNGNQAYNSAFIAESRASGTPWVNVTLAQARAECQAIGAHLITNAEWMALARDAESVASNWSGGAVNSGALAKGWATSNTGPAPRSDSTCLYNDASTDDHCSGTGTVQQRRTLNLSNGEAIWDMSGNVYERVDATISGTGSQPQDPPKDAYASVQFKDVINWGYSLGYNEVGPTNKALTSSNNVGYVYYKSDVTTTMGFLRGGVWNSSGLYMLHLHYPATSGTTSVGFRCAK